MTICAIKNTETKNISIPATAIVGGAAGLALRQFIPAQKEEIDTFLFNKSNEIKRTSPFSSNTGSPSKSIEFS